MHAGDRAWQAPGDGTCAAEPASLVLQLGRAATDQSMGYEIEDEAEVSPPVLPASACTRDEHALEAMPCLPPGAPVQESKQMFVLAMQRKVPVARSKIPADSFPPLQPSQDNSQVSVEEQQAPGLRSLGLATCTSTRQACSLTCMGETGLSMLFCSHRVWGV